MLKALHHSDKAHPLYPTENQGISADPHIPLSPDPTQGNQDNKAGRAGAYDAGEQEGATLSSTDPRRQWRTSQRVTPFENLTEAEASHRTKGQRSQVQGSSSNLTEEPNIQKDPLPSFHTLYIDFQPFPAPPVFAGQRRLSHVT